MPLTPGQPVLDRTPSDEESAQTQNKATTSFRVWGLIPSFVILLSCFILMALWSDDLAKDGNLIDAPIHRFVVLWGIASTVCFLTFFCVKDFQPHLKQQGKWFLGGVILAGLLFRLVFFFSTPILEDDHYRYLWDGAVLASGQNPYAQAPQQMSVEDVEGERNSPQAQQILAKVNHPDIKTIYPPVAQGAFTLAYYLSPYQVWGWRLILLFAELITVVLLLLILQELKLPLLRILIYWWNPIIIKEFSNAVHMDALMLPMLMGALWLGMKHKILLATVLIMLAAGVKVWPIIFLPLIWRNHLRLHKKDGLKLGGGMLLIIFIGVLLILPVYLGGLTESSGFRQYAGRWQNNDGLFKIIHAISVQVHLWLEMELWFAQSWTRRIIGGIMMIVLVLLCVKRWNPATLPGRMLFLTAALFMLSPTQFPWYYAWVLPFLVIRPVWGLLLYTVVLPFYAMQFYYESISLEHWHAFQSWGPWLQHIPVWLVLIGEGIWAWMKNGTFLPAYLKLNTTPVLSGELK